MIEDAIPSPAARIGVAALLMLAAGVLLTVPGGTPPSLTWDDLTMPLAVGQPIARGYVLSPPRRGVERDVVYTARREAGPDGPPARVEIHVLDRGRWPGVAETRSFGIAWEMPAAGSTTAFSEDDARAVRDALAAAIDRNDTGFTSVDAIPLAGEPDAPAIARLLDRFAGVRGMLIGGALALALVLLVSVAHGAAALAVLLFGLGLALRAPSLDVPFAHDQDVQRLFTGHLPLAEIATGGGLRDRHPPLYFFVLHAAQLFDQSEAVGRAPAVLVGALAGPAVLLATAAMRRRIGAAAALAALAVTVSPELVDRSREVSEIPLYALLVIAAAASLVAAVQRPRWLPCAALALAHALALWTYYLAPFIVAAHAVILLVRRPARRVVAGFAAGIALGAPALLLAVVTLFRDRAARDVARAFPGLAWGQHAPAQMLAAMGRIADGAFGWPLLALLLVAIIAGAWRRDLAVLTPTLGAAATAIGIALLAPIARVQPYYVATVLPLALLALAAAPEPADRRVRAGWAAALVLAVGCSTVPLLATARVLYVPSADAFMPRFAAEIARRPEQRVLTIAHYDKTLLAYYLARGEGRSLDWQTIDGPQAKRIEALVMVHAMEPGSEQAAAARLDEILADGATLVIERDAFQMPSLSRRLAACEPLLQAPTARLLRCAPGPG